MSDPRLPPRRFCAIGPQGLDWKSEMLARALTVGIENPIEDHIVGLIPAGVALDIRQAARACGMSMKRARRVQQEDIFQTALKRNIEARRLSMEPAHLTVCETIRDDATQPAKARLKAIEVARGPRPAAGIQVSVNARQQSLQAPAGYVIQLTPRETEHPPAEPKIIGAPPRENRAADMAADAAQERREAHAFRPR